jgi:uncharacterized protein (TIGR02117 family)
MDKNRIGRLIRWLFRKSLRVVFVFTVFILLYLSIGFVLSRISTSKELSKDQSVEIFIHSNGVHTDIVMPYIHPLKNWKKIFPGTLTRGKSADFKWLAVGWGDKGFYLETPTWGDLTVKTAFKAAFGLSSTAIHATLHPKMEEGAASKSIRLSRKQYLKLIKYVESHILKDQKGNSIFIPTKSVYGDTDAFYESNGKYSMFHTCNTWVNGALKASSQKACWWTWNSSSILRLHEK